MRTITISDGKMKGTSHTKVKQLSGSGINNGVNKNTSNRKMESSKDTNEGAELAAEENETNLKFFNRTNIVDYVPKHLQEDFTGLYVQLSKSNDNIEEKIWKSLQAVGALPQKDDKTEERRV